MAAPSCQRILRLSRVKMDVIKVAVSRKQEKGKRKKGKEKKGNSSISMLGHGKHSSTEILMSGREGINLAEADGA